MTSCDLPRVWISDPGELIETVPYLLGFHPRESLVLIGFADAEEHPGPQQVRVTVRIDLTEAAQAEHLRPLVEVLLRADSAAVAAVLVTDSVPGDPRQATTLLAWRDVLAEVMESAAIAMLDVLVATEFRWWSLCCEQLECCPTAGHRRMLDCSAAAAQATFAGMVALPDREAMAATLAGRSSEERDALLPQLARAHAELASASEHAAHRRKAEITELLCAAERSEGELSVERLVRYAVALTDRHIRDALWLAIDNGSIAANQLMSQLQTRLPSPYDAAPLFLFGWVQWRSGNATLAMMAAERVLESHPGYSAALLLHAALERGVDPRSVPVLGQAASP